MVQHLTTHVFHIMAPLVLSGYPANRKWLYMQMRVKPHASLQLIACSALHWWLTELQTISFRGTKQAKAEHLSDSTTEECSTKLVAASTRRTWSACCRYYCIDGAGFILTETASVLYSSTILSGMSRSISVGQTISSMSPVNELCQSHSADWDTARQTHHTQS